MATANTGIYEITNIHNGNRYIGSAVRIANRWLDHRRSLGRGKHHSIALQRAWDKYGESAFTFSKLIICTKENLLMYEQFLFDNCKPEYNCASLAGSMLGYKHTEASRKRMSDSRPRDFSPMKGKKHTPEALAQISANRKGKGGGPRTPERLAKIGAAHKGRTKSPEHRAKISATLTGRKQSQETIEKRMKSLGQWPRIYKAPKKSISYTPSPRLSEEQVLAIKTMRSCGRKIADIANELGVKLCVVADISCGRKYKWVSL